LSTSRNRDHSEKKKARLKDKKINSKKNYLFFSITIPQNRSTTGDYKINEQNAKTVIKFLFIFIFNGF